ncbi:MAG: hypothetical protein E7370_01720 [Clostridiales bacterium]|nr:hypothetical protein [Clostridiales bacterium]
MLFSAVGFTACTNGEMEAKIAELEAQISAQQEQIEELEQQIENLNLQIEEMNNQKSSNCEVILEETLYSGIDNCTDFIALCNSIEDFRQICLSNGYDFFDNGNNFLGNVVGEVISGYTDEYFEDKAFLVCAFYNNSWAGQYRIDEVEVMLGKLTLYIKYPRNDTADDVENSVFLIAGVDKTLVEYVTEIEYVIC